MATKGKHITPKTKVVDGKLCMLLASSRSKVVKTELFWDIRWDPKATDEDGEPVAPFILCLYFPGKPGDEDSAVSMPLDGAQGAVSYANHPRKVHPSDVPDDCPAHAILADLDSDGSWPKPPKPEGD